MRRPLWIVIAFSLGAAVGFLAAPREPAPKGSGPPIDWSADFTVARGREPAVTYRPHGATYRGREWYRREVPDLAPERIVVFRFPSPAPGVQIAATEVTP